MDTTDNDRLVGPVIKTGEIADAIVDAIREDNPGKDVIVEEHTAYLRIKVADDCLIRLETLQRVLGRKVSTGDIEANMPSFSGFIRTAHDQIRFIAKP
jgi:toluene monooxygenase system protein D